MGAAEPILAAMDWSENARRAVQRAAYISGQRGTQGILLYVAGECFFSRAINSSRSATFRRCLTRVDRFAHAIREETGFSFDTQVQAGDVATSIAKAARAAGAGLITLGQWTDSSLMRWAGAPFAESIALRLLNQISRPVLIVKSDPDKPYRRVLVGVDGTENACACIQQAHALAPDAELILVHAMDHSLVHATRAKVAYGDRLRELKMRQHEDALNRINELLEKCEVPYQKVVKIVEFGYAPKLILESETELPADLLVIGRSQGSRFRRLFFGGVTSQILARSRCDVLVVPTEGKGFIDR